MVKTKKSTATKSKAKSTQATSKSHSKLKQFYHQHQAPILTIGAVGLLSLGILGLFALRPANDQIVWNGSEYYVELNKSLHITNTGVYHLTGTIEKGNITINTTGDVKLLLDNVAINNPTGPAIFVKDANNVEIATLANTTNYLYDGTTYRGYDEDEIGAIFSHDDLILSGEGTLIIQSNNEDAIVGKDDLSITGGTYQIIAADDAIRGKDSLSISGGDFIIQSGGAALKSTNETDDGRGNMLISGGIFNLDCADDCLHSNRNLTIADGTFTIKSGDDGIHADDTVQIDGGKITITESYEGIEGETVIINDGGISIVSSDDGVNAAGGKDASGMGRPGFKTDQFSNNTSNGSSPAIYLNGGKITVNADGDGIDSNGSVYMTGGEVTVYGPTNNGNGALDYDREFVVTGGTLLAGGASGMAQGISSNSTIYGATIYFDSNVDTNIKVSILDSSNKEILTYTSVKSYSSLAIASPKLEKGKTYTIKIGNTVFKTFTISEIVTQVGTKTSTGGFGGRGEGNMGGFGGRFGDDGSTPPELPSGIDGAAPKRR